MRVSDHIYMSSTFGRTYVIEGDDALVMIDTFTSLGVREALREFAEKDRLDLARLRALLLTHMHYDHAAGAAYVRSTYGVPVICHPLEADAIARGDHLMTGEMRWLNTYEHVPVCPIDYLAEDGDTIAVGSLEITVAHVPGHTRGGVGYLWEGHLFLGDTMFPNGGIGWSDVHWGSNLPDHIESIRRIAELKPKRLYGGHGDPADYAKDVTDAALAHIQKLWDVGLASKGSQCAPRRADDAARRRITVSGLPAEPEMPVGKPSRDLRSLPQYEVGSGNLRGTIRPIGELHGLILCGEGDVPITLPRAATMNLEHYCEIGRCGRFTPRIEVAQSYELAPESVTVRFGPHPRWNVASAVTYTQRGDAAFDILFSFEFGADYPKFEAFVASYFWGKRIPYVMAGGACFRPDIKPGQQLFFPRDAEAREQVDDGRWSFLKDANLFAEADPGGRFYDAPLTIHRDDETGWTFLQMADRRKCAAISVNTFAYAQDFSLVGHDVRKGERVRVRARVAYVKLDSPEQALDVYRAFQEEVEA